MIKIAKLMMVSLCILIAALSGIVYADVTVGSVSFGGSSQERGANLSKTFVITNTFSVPVTLNSVSASVDPKFQFDITSATSLPATIAASGQLTFTAKSVVPGDFDAVDADGEQQSFGIGSVTASWFNTGTNVSGQTTSQVSMQAESNLEISSADIDITGFEESSGRISDGKDFDVRPGDSIVITVKIENNYDEDDDISFEDAEVRLEIEDDGDFEIDDESDSVSLDGEEDDLITFKIDVDDDADRGDHTVKLMLADITTADDDAFDDSLQGELLEFNINVERESHDLQISRFEVSPTVLTCDAVDRTVSANLQVVNRGTRDEDNAAMEVVASSLGLNKKESDLSIDRDQRKSQVFSFVVPKTAPSGTHQFRANAYIVNSAQTDSEVVSITVEGCGVQNNSTSTSSSQSNSQSTQSGPVVVSQPPASSTFVTASPTASQGAFFDSPVYVGLLIAGIVFLIAVIAGLIVLAVR